MRAKKADRIQCLFWAVRETPSRGVVRFYWTGLDVTSELLRVSGKPGPKVSGSVAWSGGLN